MLRMVMTLVLATVLSACAGVQVEDYSELEPRLDVETFFSGDLTAHGVVQNRAGRVTRTFTATIDAYWEDGVGTLEEDFVFDDGEQQRRVWTLTPDGHNRYRGTAGDVVGEATLVQSGNSAFLDYVLRIPVGDTEIDVRVDDRMYLVSRDVLINESELSKFGVRVGALLLTIIRQPGSEQ